MLYAGVELGGTKCVAILAQGPNDVVARETVPTTNPDETLGSLEQIVRGWKQTHQLAALGIASFGPIDVIRGSATYGHMLATPKPGWPGTEIASRLQSAAGVPAAFDTDVNGAAFAEMHWGSGRGFADFAYVTVGTGIGVGLIVTASQHADLRIASLVTSDLLGIRMTTGPDPAPFMAIAWKALRPAPP